HDGRGDHRSRQWATADLVHSNEEPPFAPRRPLPSQRRQPEGRHRSALALLPNPGGFPGKPPQIIKLGAAHPAPTYQLDRRDRRAVERKDALDSDTGGHFADGEVLADAATSLGYDQALERLEPLFIALFHPHHDPDSVPRLERGDVRAQALS